MTLSAGPWTSALEPFWLDFERNFEILKQSHRFIELASMREAARVWDEISRESHAEDFDGGDAYYEMEQRLGADPYEVVAYNGMTSLSRAVSLWEITVARVGARFFKENSDVVFKSGRTWEREKCVDFFKSCLVAPINPYMSFMKPLTALRDRFAHGYGVFSSREEADRLARLLHQQVNTGPATPDEEALGFGGSAYFFGQYVSYDSRTGLSSDFFAPIKAELSPLATHRMLGMIHTRMKEVVDHAALGLKSEQELPQTRFAQKWLSTS